MWRNPMPWKNSPETPNIGDYRADRRHPARPRLGRSEEPRELRYAGRRVRRRREQRELRRAVRLDARRDAPTPRHRIAGRRLAAAHAHRRRHQPDRLRHPGQPGGLQRRRRQLQRQRRRWRRRRAAAAGAAWHGRRDGPRHARRSRCLQGRPALEARDSSCRARPTVAAVAVRAADRRAAAQPAEHHSAGVSVRASRCGSRIRTSCSCRDCSRAAATSRSGRSSSTCRWGRDTSCCFANNPMWRGATIGSYFLVFNAILNFDNLNAGRKLDEK